MRSAVFNSFGDPSQVLRIEDRPIPNPGPGDVRVKTILSPVHNHDLLTISGQYGDRPTFPAIAGSEAVGTIDALGDGVEGLLKGQRISVAGARGAWSDFFIADANNVVPVPDKVSNESAAQLVGMPLSALFLLKFMDARPGQWIIQNAATGAVASALAMAAQSKGVNVINLVRRDEDVADLASIGIRNGVSTERTDWRKAVQDIVDGNPITAAIDGVGGTASGDLLSLISENGVLVSFGAMSGRPMEIPPGDLIFRQALVKGFWFSKLRQKTPSSEMGAIVVELLNLVASDIIRLRVDAIFDLEKVSDAIRANAMPARRGKILLRL